MYFVNWLVWQKLRSLPFLEEYMRPRTKNKRTFETHMCAWACNNLTPIFNWVDTSTSWVLETANRELFVRKRNISESGNVNHSRAKGFGLAANESWAPTKVMFPYFRSQNSERRLQSCSDLKDFERSVFCFNRDSRKKQTAWKEGLQRH